MGVQRIVDGDTHVLEPVDIWDTWLPRRFWDKAPKLVKDVDGGDAWQFAGATDPDPIGLVATPGKPYDEFRWTGVSYDDARPGCYDGAERLKDMDADGVDAAVLFAPQRTIGHFLGDEDDDFVRSGVDAYNRFLVEQFCAPDPNRLVALAQMPSTGTDDCVEALRKAHAGGFRGVVISCWPSGRDSVSDADDPFWAAASAEGMPVCIHINLISRRARQAQRRAGAERLAASAKKGSAGAHAGRSSKANAKAVAGLGGVFSVVPSTIGQLIFTGVFERFPSLQVNMIETGVGWIPHFLEQLDDRYWRNRSWGEIPIVEPPSFYWRRNMAATFITDRTGIALRYAVGVENMMWSSDYPHHGNDWPYSRKVIEEMMGHIPAGERNKIIGGNASRIYGLEQGA
ncbi:MAG: amidohydrolase family protein [Actinomycetota bacterium]|jgi:predicted TIM-barrel fold metal-dependent hydrolase|nr:amidohydrolase family protein [Actinomycetota bacterium]